MRLFVSFVVLGAFTIPVFGQQDTPNHSVPIYRVTVVQRSLQAQLFAESDLVNSQAQYQTSIDQFKVLLGMPVEQNLEIAAALADTCIVLAAGRVVWRGSARDATSSEELRQAYFA